MRLKQGFIRLPSGVGIRELVLLDGESDSPQRPAVPATPLTLGELRDRYVATHRKSLEARTIDGTDLHFKHLAAALGERFPIHELKLADLQG